VSSIAKIALVFGVSFVIVVVSFIAYYFGMTNTSRYEMRRRYLRLVNGGSKKEYNTQGESLRQNFLQGEESDDNV
tara:strand:+ start:244 stop:468 length:225 start_codon:yes stop_codon:yes gene_type:complete